MRRTKLLVSCVAIMVALGVPAATATAGAASNPSCGITWGSQLKSAPDLVPATIAGVRLGRHDCYDRLVVDVSGSPAPGSFVHYTDGLSQPGSGDLVAVSGGAVLTINALAPSYDVNGNPTTPWRAGGHIASTTSFRTFRDVVYAGSFEGETTLGLGVRARLPFRVLKLENPSRLVIDVAHRW